MKNLADNIALIVATLWVGGMWAIGYLAAPTLFTTLADKSLAGMLAGKLFTLIAYVGIVSGSYLLIYRLMNAGISAFKQKVFWLVLIMLLLTLAGHFGIQPIMNSLKAQAMPREVMESAFRSRFATWHGIASIVYLVESILGLLLIVQQRANSR